MRFTKSFGLFCATLVALSVTPLILTGCGGGGSGLTSASSPPSSSGTTRVRGTASAPSSQLAQVTRAAPGANSRLQTGQQVMANAQVVVSVQSTGQALAQGVTNANGQFDIPVNLTSTTVVTVTVTQTGNGTTVTVQNVVTVTPGSEVTVTVDIVSTVGAAAFVHATNLGFDHTVAIEVESDVESEAEANGGDENEVDLTDHDHAHSPNAMAMIHIAALADRKLQAYFAAPDANTAARALFASEVFAQIDLGLSDRVNLSGSETQALVSAMATGTTTTAAHIAAALASAGVTTTSGAAITVQDVLDAAVRLRDKLSAFGPAASVTSTTAFSLDEAYLLAVQVNAPQVAFNINSQAQLDAYVNALLS